MNNYKYLVTENKLGYSIVTLQRKKSNPLNLEVLQELQHCFTMLQKDENVRGVILAGQDDFFSVGVDVIEVFKYDHEKAAFFWKTLMLVMMQLFKFPKPLIAAITGHAPAGGCVLAIPADYRIMAEGPYTIGLNEMPLGIAVPEIFFEIYSFWLGRRKAYQYLLEGKLLTADEALQDGLVDEVSALPEIIPQAENKLGQYLKIIPAVFETSKLSFRQSIISRFEQGLEDILNIFLEQWWADETRATIQTLIHNLKKKNSAN